MTGKHSVPERTVGCFHFERRAPTPLNGSLATLWFNVKNKIRSLARCFSEARKFMLAL
jgi:hypothetical protein